MGDDGWIGCGDGRGGGLSEPGYNGGGAGREVAGATNRARQNTCPLVLPISPLHFGGRLRLHGRQ